MQVGWCTATAASRSRRIVPASSRYTTGELNHCTSVALPLAALRGLPHIPPIDVERGPGHFLDHVAHGSSRRYSPLAHEDEVRAVVRIAESKCQLPNYRRKPSCPPLSRQVGEGLAANCGACGMVP